MAQVKLSVAFFALATVTGIGTISQILDTLNEISQTQRQMSNTLSLVATLLQNSTGVVTSTESLAGAQTGANQRADCSDRLSKKWSSGIYTIHPAGGSYRVYCDMETDGGGWTVFQRRFDGSVDFYRNWANYTQGFGSLDGEFWLGLERIHLLTIRSGQSWELMIKLVDFDDDIAYARYESFSVGDEASNYVLHIGSYSGTAGDSLPPSKHNNKPFTTHDRDNDDWRDNCAYSDKGAWWYYACTQSNLNGGYFDSGSQGMIWRKWKSWDSLKASTMMMRPVQ